MSLRVWQVVGGREKGGIVVRVARELKSLEEPSRLATGAFVKQVELVGDRLRYRRLRGRGPDTGWVSIKLKERDIVVEHSEVPQVPLRVTESAERFESARALQDASVHIGNLVAQVKCPESGRLDASCCVVLCAGNPGENFGCFHAGSELIFQIGEALGEIGVPNVRFDYSGVGMSAAGARSPQEWTPMLSEHPRDVRRVVAWAKDNLSQNVVLCGFSYGTGIALDAALAGEACGFMVVSMGYNFWVFYTDKAEQELAKANLERHSLVRCPALFVVGDKDRMTPLDLIQRLAGARADGGQAADIKILRQTCLSKEAHQMHGQEAEVGQMCADWVECLRAELIETRLLASQLPASEAVLEKHT